MKPNFYDLEPLNEHCCLHCQHSILDVAIAAYKCKHLHIELSRLEFIQPNDCKDWLSEWMNDHKQHKSDLKRKTK